jgi:hypothetical protein
LGGSLVIILDTNAAKIRVNGAQADLLKVIAATGHERVAVPWVVMEEMVAQKAIPHREEWQQTSQKLARLQRLRPWDDAVQKLDLGPEQGDAFREYWRAEYSKIYETLPTSENALREGLLREANCIKPAKLAGENKIGGRDAALWMTVVEYAKAHPEGHIYFVTNNSHDFGDGVTWPPPLDEDIRDFRDRITLIPKLEDLIARFTQPIGDVDSVAARDILSQKPFRESIEALALEVNVAVDLVNPWAGVTTSVLKGLTEESGEAVVPCFIWARKPWAHPIEVSDLKGHRIGDRVWFTAMVGWILIGSAITSTSLFEGPNAERCAAKWATRVLFSEGEDSPITLLDHEAPTGPSKHEVLLALGKKDSVEELESDRYDLPADTDDIASAIARLTDRSADDIWEWLDSRLPSTPLMRARMRLGDWGGAADLHSSDDVLLLQNLLRRFSQWGRPRRGESPDV